MQKETSNKSLSELQAQMKTLTQRFEELRGYL